jgi:hypothetical protein
MLLRALCVLFVSVALATTVRADDSTCAALSLAGDNSYWDEVESCEPCVAAGCVYVCCPTALLRFALRLCWLSWLRSRRIPPSV